MSGRPNLLAEMIAAQGVIHGDYVNEFLGFLARAEMAAIAQKNFDPDVHLTNISAADLLAAFKAARETSCVRTFAQRVEHIARSKFGPEVTQAYTAAQQNPEWQPLIKQLDGLAHKLNTSENVVELRTAYDQAMRLMGRAPFFDRSAPQA